MVFCTARTAKEAAIVCAAATFVNVWLVAAATGLPSTSSPLTE